MERQPGYQVAILVRRHVDSYKTPKLLGPLLSVLSESEIGRYGDDWPGMSREEAEQIVSKITNKEYLAADGKLRCKKGVIIRVS